MKETLHLDHLPYDGWKNWETQALYIHLTGDQERLNSWIDLAANVRADADDVTKRHPDFDREKWMLGKIGNELKDWHKKASRDTRIPRGEEWIKDLLDDALGEVDWRELANWLLEEVKAVRP